VALGAVRWVLFLALPASAILGALAAPVVRLLFQRGQFTDSSTLLTSAALLAYACGLAAFAAAEIIVRTFYAMQDTRTPVVVGAGAVLINILLGWTALRLGAGLGGLALAFSTASTIEAIVLLALLGPRLGGLGDAFRRAFGCMLLATAACTAVLALLLPASIPALPFLQESGYGWPQDFPALAVWTSAAAVLGGLVYAGAAALLRIDELETLRERAERVLGRR
jgi:putative peptidoglycan lipid II flippase